MRSSSAAAWIWLDAAGALGGLGGTGSAVTVATHPGGNMYGVTGSVAGLLLLQALPLLFQLLQQLLHPLLQPLLLLLLLKEPWQMPRMLCLACQFLLERL